MSRAMRFPERLDTARAVPLALVAGALGLDVRRGAIGPCPACGVVQRGSEDRRPPVGVTSNGLGWRCFACDASGDGPSLARHALHANGLREVLDWYAAQRWIESAESERWPTEALRPYPPGTEVLAVLRACVPVRESASCRDFLARRSLPLDVPAAALPRPSWPGWETLSVAGEDAEGRPRTWWPGRWAGLWRLAVPAVDAHGRIRSFQARAVRDGAKHKTKWPAGCRAGGLLFADPWRARPALRGGGPWPETVLLVEGLTDYLAACAAVLHEEPALDIAVLGLCSGGASALLEAHVPVDRLVSAIDSDDTGDRYNRAVCDLLGPVRRVCLDGPTEQDTRRGPDLAEALAGWVRCGKLLVSPPSDAS